MSFWQDLVCITEGILDNRIPHSNDVENIYERTMAVESNILSPSGDLDKEEYNVDVGCCFGEHKENLPVPSPKPKTKEVA